MKTLLTLFATLAFLGWTSMVRADHTEFVQKAAVGGMAEVKMGQIASQQGENADVRKFGQRMVTDHTKAGLELMQIAAKKNIAIPRELDKKHADMVSKFQASKGADFDKAYMSHMVKDHEEDVALFEKEAKNGTDPDVKAFAAKSLPTLKEHLQMAKDIAAKVGAK